MARWTAAENCTRGEWNEDQAAGRWLEQQYEERAGVESEQEPTGQQEQQSGVPLRLGYGA
jgi:hypothetical protein